MDWFVHEKWPPKCIVMSWHRRISNRIKRGRNPYKKTEVCTQYMCGRKSIFNSSLSLLIFRKMIEKLQNQETNDEATEEEDEDKETNDEQTDNEKTEDKDEETDDGEGK